MTATVTFSKSLIDVLLRSEQSLADITNQSFGSMSGHYSWAFQNGENDRTFAAAKCTPAIPCVTESSNIAGVRLPRLILAKRLYRL